MLYEASSHSSDTSRLFLWKSNILIADITSLCGGRSILFIGYFVHPQSCILEYEIAGSGLYRLLATAIKAAQKEVTDPEQEMTDEVLKDLWSEVKTDYPDGHTPTREEAYRIFEPLNEGTVSKAITAQYLAGMLTGDLPPVSDGTIDKNDVRHIVETDEKLKYLVEAIKHVTE